MERVPVIPPAIIHGKRPSIGIALGGGFARGLAHIGVLKVLEENNIPIDYIAGTSVGAVIGAAYASGVSGKELTEIAALVRFKDIGRYTISRYGLCSNDRLIGLLQRVLRVRTFEELRIPLAVTATDFVSGEPVIFRKGDLASAMFYTVSGNYRLDEIEQDVAPGQVVGEVGLIAPDNKRTLTFACIEDGELLTISYEQVKQLYFQNPKFGFYFLQLISRRLFQDIARLQDKARIGK